MPPKILSFVTIVPFDRYGQFIRTFSNIFSLEEDDESAGKALTKELVLQAMDEGSARPGAHEADTLGVQLFPGGVVRPLLARGPLPALVALLLPLVRRTLALQQVPGHGRTLWQCHRQRGRPVPPVDTEKLVKKDVAKEFAILVMEPLVAGSVAGKILLRSRRQQIRKVMASLYEFVLDTEALITFCNKSR